MRIPADYIDQLLAREAYKICRLLTAADFVKFCEERGLDVSEERLLKLERLGLFHPLLRSFAPDAVHKIELLDGGASYRDLGQLEDGESWEGEVRSEQLRFSFWKPIVDSWREHACLWDARHGASPHQASIASEPNRHEAYYSQFQFWDLMSVLTQLTLKVHIEGALDDDGKVNGHLDKLPGQVEEMARQAISRAGEPRFRDAIGLLCQLISDRYFPQTQTDQRQFQLSIDSRWHAWDWYAFARQWEAKPIAEAFELTQDQSKRIYEQLSAEQAMRDPIEAWYKLVRFIGLDRRRRAKKQVLGAMALRDMAQMLRRFHEDAFGERLPDPNETLGTIIHRIPDVEPEEDPFLSLQLVANDFQLNPKPRLVLIIEGQTEEVVVPLIFERLFAARLSVCGIQLRNMRGVANATGSKKDSMSALWRLIDHLHQEQTIAMVLLDREGLAAKNVGAGLLNARSIFFPDRMVTRRDYVKLWRRSFELDNFSDKEIALGLTRLAKAPIEAKEVAAYRKAVNAKGGSPISLDSIFRAATGRGLNKLDLGRELVAIMFDPATKRSPMNRPIARFLKRVGEAAARNHQPITRSLWEYNQRTGHLGALIRGAVSRRRKPFG